MRYLPLLFVIFLFGCEGDRIVLLPEIENVKITELSDVSPAYVFYDETQSDSTVFNRKNLITATNWLVNIDKRLTLKQILPHLQYLQNKRKKAKSHKNYFTCNDMAIKNLGFLEFTDVNYKEENPDFITFSKNNPNDYTLVHCFENGKIELANSNIDFKTIISEKESISNSEDFKTLFKDIKYRNLVLFFESEMTFQQYITIKSYFTAFSTETFKFSENEFLF